MKHSDAVDAVARLRAAFPAARFDEANVLAYAEELAALASPAALADAVRALIRTEDRLPSIAKIREEYRRYVDRYAPPALGEPDLTPAEVALNAKRARELAARIGRTIEDKP